MPNTDDTIRDLLLTATPPPAVSGHQDWQDVLVRAVGPIDDAPARRWRRRFSYATAAGVAAVAAAAALLALGSPLRSTSEASAAIAAIDPATGMSISLANASSTARPVILVPAKLPVLRAWVTTRPFEVGLSSVRWLGRRISQLEPGTYEIVVSTRGAISYINFHLVGPGVNRSTKPGQLGLVTWTVRLTKGSYKYFSDVASVIKPGRFTVG